MRKFKWASLWMRAETLVLAHARSLHGNTCRQVGGVHVVRGRRVAVWSPLFTERFRMGERECSRRGRKLGSETNFEE